MILFFQFQDFQYSTMNWPKAAEGKCFECRRCRRTLDMYHFDDSDIRLYVKTPNPIPLTCLDCFHGQQQRRALRHVSTMKPEHPLNALKFSAVQLSSMLRPQRITATVPEPLSELECHFQSRGYCRIIIRDNRSEAGFHQDIMVLEGIFKASGEGQQVTCFLFPVPPGWQEMDPTVAFGGAPQEFTFNVRPDGKIDALCHPKFAPPFNAAQPPAGITAKWIVFDSLAHIRANAKPQPNFKPQRRFAAADAGNWYESEMIHTFRPSGKYDGYTQNCYGRDSSLPGVHTAGVFTVAPDGRSVTVRRITVGAGWETNEKNEEGNVETITFPIDSNGEVKPFFPGNFDETPGVQYYLSEEFPYTFKTEWL